MVHASICGIKRSQSLNAPFLYAVQPRGPKLAQEQSARQSIHFIFSLFCVNFATIRYFRGNEIGQCRSHTQFVLSQATVMRYPLGFHFFFLL